MEFDFIMIAPLLSYFSVISSLSLYMEYLFCGGFQRPPIDGRSTASCDFGALTEGDALIFL